MRIYYTFLIFFMIFLSVSTTAGLAGAETINVPTDYPTIQQAIANSNSGDEIIVANGTYNEQIVVNKSLTLIGIGLPEIDGQRITGKNTVTLNSSGAALNGFLITNGGLVASGIEIISNDVEVHNCTVTNNRGTGIEINNVNGAIIRDSIVRDNVESSSLGISIYSSTNCLLQNNTLKNNNVYNLELDVSSYNIIQNNTFSSAGWNSVVLSSGSQFNIFSQNMIEETDAGHGVLIADSDNNVFRSNTIRNNSLLYDYSYAGFFADTVSNLTLIDNLLSGNNNYGIYIYDCDNSNFSNNTITNTLDPQDAGYSVGFYLESSASNTLENNTIADNEHRGIFLQSSRYNTLSNNNITGNPYNFGATVSSTSNYFVNYIDESNLLDGKPIIYLMDGVGITINETSNAGVVYCISCENVTVENLTLTNNSYGIVLYDSINSTIRENSVVSCEEGIFLIISNNNTITCNNVSENLKYGIRVRSSDFNNIYFNDFANNGNSDYRSDTSTTYWRSPVELLYFFGGNQYISYLGNDWNLYAGTDANGDGIGDSSYTISGDTNDDDYPLIQPTAFYSFTENQPPGASFSYFPRLPHTGETVSFTDTSTDIDGLITAWLWNFGNGNTSTLKNPSNIYTTPGFFQVELNVTDDSFSSDNVTNTIFVYDQSPMTLYVPDNFSTIQQAVNICRDEDSVLVRAGTYNENVIVNRSITITGEDRPAIDADYGTGFTITSSGCIIEGFNITKATDFDGAGISVTSDRNIIRNNIVNDNFRGIYLESSDNNTLFNNTCSDNDECGILLISSMNNVIFNNTCNNNSEFGGESQGYGIEFSSSSGNILYFNDFDNPNRNVPGTYYNAYDSNNTEPANQWFNATILKGNRYSDYQGVDGNEDGVGDTPYEIDTISTSIPISDPYPLMPYSPMPEFEPLITEISTSDLTYSSINFRWSILNDVNSDNRVLYGTNDSLTGAQWSAWNNSSTSPQIALTDLAQNTTYYYSCYSYNAQNDSLFDNSSISSFRTTERVNLVLTVDDDNADIPTPPADYSTLTDAITNAIDGDKILVYSGTYTDNYVVDKTLNITGIGLPVLAGKENEVLSEMGDVVTLEADGCILQGFRIIDAHWTNTTISSLRDSACVRIGKVTYNEGFGTWSYSGSENNIVQDNILEDGRFAVYLNRYSTNNLIRENTLNDTYEGVLFDYSRNNILDNNDITNIDHYPVRITRLDYMSYYPSTNNTISNNTISDSGFNWGIEVDHTSDNRIMDNILSESNLIEIFGDRNLISGNSVLGDNDYHKAGIHVSDGEDNVLLNNTVTYQRFGILLTPSTENVTMRDNRIDNNTYNFGFTGDWYFAGHTASTHSIDTSNTINGDPIYYLIGQEDAVYSYSTMNPSPGYLACIDCNNVTINDFYFEKNAQGLFLYNTTGSYVDGVTTHANAEYGIQLHDADNLIISNANVDSNGLSSNNAGVFLETTTGCIIEDSTITGNKEIGIKMWYECPDTVIRNSEITNNGDSSEPGSGTGIYVSGSDTDNVTIHSNIIANTYSNLQGTGLKTWADNSIVYNNHFNNTDTDAYSASTGTTWNVTPVAGINIIGGGWIAGNYWSGYTGSDTDEDGLGDTLVPFNVNGNILFESGDYHPLLDTYVPDITLPILEIISPVEGNTYLPQLVYLEVTSPDEDVAFWWHSLNGNENVSFVPNASLTNLPEGCNNITVYVNDTSGNENHSMVNFTVAPDTTAPAIYVISPENNTEYNQSRDIPLEVWSPDSDVFSWWCSLDNGENVTFTPNSTLSNVANGDHILVVYVDDVVGNTNSTEIMFSVNVTTSPASNGGGGVTGLAVIISHETEEEEDKLLIITSPDDGTTIYRNLYLAYTSKIPLARAYYSVDNGDEHRVEPYISIPVNRLDLGMHVLTVKGVDYYGDTVSDSVIVEVMPIAIGEVDVAGTPDFPDEAVFAFVGNHVNYTLTFEATNIEDGEIGVYLNRFISGDVDGNRSIEAYRDTGGILCEPTGSSEWHTYSCEVPSTWVVPDSENFLAFINTENVNSSESIGLWSIRDVVLKPENTASCPEIEIFATEKVFSSGDELTSWIRINGIINEEDYEASVYLIGPDGSTIPFPDGYGSVQLLDISYLDMNYNGRLPGSLAFDDSFASGIYRLVASLTRTDDNSLESLSSFTLYYSDKPSMEFFLNRDAYYPGSTLSIDLALTGGQEKIDANVVLMLEAPDASVTYLPSDGSYFASIQQVPLQDRYMNVYEKEISDEWQEGIYSVRGLLFDQDGNILDKDLISFEVCNSETDVSIEFVNLPGSAITSTDIRFVNTLTFDLMSSATTTGDYRFVDVMLPIGSYWVIGEIYTEDGYVYRIPLTRENLLEIRCSENMKKLITILEEPVIEGNIEHGA